MQRNNAIQLIKQRTNIVAIVNRYVELKRNGLRWSAPCPFHQETKPSFHVDEEKGLFYCFGCQASGDLFDFYGRINGLDFKETLEQLALECDVELGSWQGQKGKGAKDPKNGKSLRQNTLRMYELAEEHFKSNLQLNEGATCRAYMQDRQISQEIIKQFGLGYAKNDWNALANFLQRAGFSEKDCIASGLLAKSDKSGRAYDRFRDRLIFPIYSLAQKVIAFGGRIIENKDEAKYINSSDSPIYKKGEHIYGLAQARRSITIKNNALLTEGYMDVLTLHQFGYTHAVGVLGTALTPEQVKRLSGFTKNIILLFDGDKPGRKAAMRACEMFLTRGLACKVVLLPEGEDIDSLLHSQGTQAFEELLSQAPDGLTFCIDILRKQSPSEQVDWARNFLQQIEIAEIKSPFASKLAMGLQLTEHSLRESVATTPRRQTQHNAQNHTGIHGKPLSPLGMRDKQIMMFAVRYPHRLKDVQNLGGEMALHSEVSRTLWNKIEEFGPENVFYELNEREKYFWISCRTGDAPPMDEGDKELKSLAEALENFAENTQKSSISAALRENARTGDFSADLEYLKVLQESLGRKHE